MPRSVLGVNLGNHTIKVVEVGRGRTGLVLQSLAIAPTKEAVVSGEVIQPDVVAMTLRDLLRDIGPRTRDAVVAIGGQTGVVVRVVDLPKMPRKELFQAIPYEIERHLPPFQGTQKVVRDFVLLKEPEEVEEGGQVPVLFAAARGDLVDAYLAAIQQAGLSPLAMEVEPLAAARSFYAAQGFPEPEDGAQRVSVLVNIGHEATEISFVQGGMLLFTRVVPIGGRHLTEAIRDHLGMEMEEAERAKVESGTAWMETPPPPQVSPPETPTIPVGPETPPQTPPLQFPLPGPPEQPPTETPEEEGKEKPPEPPTIRFDLELPNTPEERTEGTPETPSLEFLPGQEPSVPPPEEPTPTEPTPSKTPTPHQPPIERLLYEAMQAHLVELVGEITRSVEFFATRLPNLTVEGIYLLGGGSLLKDLDRFLGEQLGVPVNHLNPFKEMETDPVVAKFGQDYLQRMAPLFAIATGLALWAYL